jgi:hypothetical protein
MAQFYADRVSVGSHRAYTPEGFLLVTGVPIARTGFQTYRAEEVDKDGSLGLSGLVDVYRPKEEVLSPATLASFEGKTITCPHPPQFLTPSNDGHYYRGHVQNVRAGKEKLPDGEWPIIADILIKDGTTISLVDNEHFEELSAGYSYDLVPYDAGKGNNVAFMQKNIRGNHVALVAAGRAGGHVRVLDSSPVEGSMSDAVEKKTGLLSDIGSFFRDLKDSGFRLVAVDAESETVKRQEQIAEKSNSLKERTLDMKTAKDDELEKEEKGAKKPVEAKDEDEKKEAKDSRQANDALLKTMADGINKLVQLATDAKAKDAEKDKEEEKKEAKDADKDDKDKDEAEDSDLIAVATLSPEERPENPIPGADAALAGLRLLRPAIAALESREATDTFNHVILAIKGKLKATDSGYKKLIGTKKPEVVKTAEDRARLTAKDSAEQPKNEGGGDFFESAAKFHRQNPTEVKIVQ